MSFEYRDQEGRPEQPDRPRGRSARVRELWQSVRRGSASVVVLLLYAAWQHFELIRYGYRIEQLQEARQQEERINRHLRLQVQTLQRPQRIEQIARTQLKMVPPGPADAIVLERVRPADPPDKSSSRSGRTETPCLTLPIPTPGARRSASVSPSLPRIFALWCVGVQARLAWLQVYRHDHYVRKADFQWKRTLALPALRGTIYDRDGRVLATSADVDSVYAAPSEIDQPKQVAAKLCAVLEGCRNCREQLAQLEERLSKRRPFAWVKRHVSPDEARAVEALDLDGVGMQKESRRFYPMRELLAPVVGYVGIDNRGLGGIEQRYNDAIRGQGRPGPGLHRRATEGVRARGQARRRPARRSS